MALSNLVKTVLLVSVAVPVAYVAYAQEQGGLAAVEDTPIVVAGGVDKEPSKARKLDAREQEDGLKELLRQCVRYAARSLASQDSFMKNPRIRLGIPSTYKRGNTLLIDTENQPEEEFVLHLNRAAEKSIPKVAGYFMVAVGQMRNRDVLAVAGDDNNTAATLQLHHRMAKGLIEVVRPVIKSMMEHERLEPVYAVSRSEVDVSAAVPVPFDAENYLIEKVLEVFFVYMSKEEQAMRMGTSSCDEEIACWYINGEAPKK